MLHRAHRALEGLTLSKDTLRFNRTVADELAQLTLRRPLVQRPATRPARLRVAPRSASSRARSRLRLDHGTPIVAGRRSPLSLYDKNLATYDKGDAFDHKAAVGFIEIFGLPLRTEAARHGAVGKRHGAAWTWTDPLLDGLPTTVTDQTPARGHGLTAMAERSMAPARGPPGDPAQAASTPDDRDGPRRIRNAGCASSSSCTSSRNWRPRRATGTS